MKDLTGVSGSFPAQRSLETGEELNEANIEEAFQSAADRAQHLLVKVSALETLTMADGVKLLRSVATTTALKNLNSPAFKDLALCLATPNAFGLFMYVSAPLLPADIPGFAYNSTTATGYWLNVTSPLVTLGGFGGDQPRLNAAIIKPPNHIVSFIDYYESGSPLNVDSDGTWQNSGFVSDPVALQEGDKVDISAIISVGLASASDEFELRLATNDQTAIAAISNTNMVVCPKNATAKVPMVLRGQFVAQSSVSHTFLVQFNGPGGAPIAQTIHAKRSFKGIVYRP